jgi:hypothetical protein
MAEIDREMSAITSALASGDFDPKQMRLKLRTVTGKLEVFEANLIARIKSRAA